MAEGSSSKIEFLIWLSQVMGGLCSRSASEDDMVSAKTGENVVVGANNKNNLHPGGSNKGTSGFTTAPVVGETMDRNLQLQQPAAGTSGTDEDFYDGIPRFSDTCPHKSRSERSRQIAVAKVGFKVSTLVYRYIALLSIL